MSDFGHSMTTAFGPPGPCRNRTTRLNLEHVLHAILWTVAVIWGFSGCATVVIFGLDARAHRRRTDTQSVEDRPVIARSAERGMRIPASASA